MDYRFTKKKKELPHEAKVKLEKIEISENDVDYRFPLENKNSKPNENLQLKEIKIHENDVDYRYKLDNVNSKDSGNNNDYKLIPIKKFELKDASRFAMTWIDSNALDRNYNKIEEKDREKR